MRAELKNKALRFLNESEGHVHIDPSVIGDVKDVDINPEEDYVRIDFSTPYGQSMSILAKYGRFKGWFERNKEKFANVFHAFVIDFLKTSKEVQEQPMEEIVDGDGNLYGDEDLPPNSTNSMVGTSVWDLEKVYRSGYARSTRRYSGDLGIGRITW